LKPALVAELKSSQSHDDRIDHSCNHGQGDKRAVDVLPFVIFPSHCIQRMVQAGENEKENEAEKNRQFRFNAPIQKINNYGNHGIRKQCNGRLPLVIGIGAETFGAGRSFSKEQTFKPGNTSDSKNYHRDHEMQLCNWIIRIAKTNLVTNKESDANNKNAYCVEDVKKHGSVY
jgi:hypothetical protein